MPLHNEPTIQTATTEWQLPAVRLLLSAEPPDLVVNQLAIAIKTLRSVDEQRQYLLVAKRGGELVGSVWAQTLPGRTAVLWPPRLAGNEPNETADRLLAELDQRLVQSGIGLVQAVLSGPTAGDVALLRTAGFRHVVELLYLSCQPDSNREPPSQRELRFVNYRKSDRARLARLIDSTYECSLDVPMLNGARQLDDIIDGYENTGDSGAAAWFLACCGDRDVGCLLLAQHTPQEQWELVYMGLNPAARGNGWGQLIVEQAMWFVSQSAFPRLVLAVDAANEPALSIYSRAGFMESDRRTVFLRLPAAPGA